MQKAFATDRLRVFFAYKRAEASPYFEQVETVYRELKNHGFEVYRDQESIELGTNWRRALTEAIGEADVGLVNWTPGAEDSDEVLAEADELLLQKKYCGVFFAEIPKFPNIKAVQSISLHDWAGDLNDPRWRRLISHLERLAKRQKRALSDDAHAMSDGGGIANVNPDGQTIQEEASFPILRRVRAPASFNMGEPPPGEDDGGWGWGAVPITFARPFAIGKYPVSNREWRAAIAAGADVEDASSLDGQPDEPVTRVSFFEAQKYIAWLNYEVAGVYYRMPSEAEWEFAKRSGFLEDRSPVVREWVGDAFSPVHHGASPDGQPRRDVANRHRTVRGVAASNIGSDSSTLFRTGYARDFSSDDLGFRIARTI